MNDSNPFRNHVKSKVDKFSPNLTELSGQIPASIRLEYIRFALKV